MTPILHSAERPSQPYALEGDAPTRSQRLDPIARQTLIEKYIPMVRKVAFRLASRYPSCVDAEDLVNMGMFGLIDAVDRFEQDRSISFAGYARIRVQGAIVDEMRKADWVPRSVRDRGDRIRDAKESLKRSLGRDATEAEVAGHLGVSEDRLRELNMGSTIHNVVSIADGIDEDHSVGDSIPSEQATPSEVAEGADFRNAIRLAVGSLPDRDRMIVELYYFREVGFKEIGQLLGVTESRVSQLHTRIMNNLRPLLAEVQAQYG
jgi:RNA polymerase sigma factor for flagellar operon FliA